jgi:hypothetical protein
LRQSIRLCKGTRGQHCGTIMLPAETSESYVGSQGMWRKTVLHFHTTPNERSADPFNAEEVVAVALAEGVNVIAVTDHNSIERVEAVAAAAAGTELVVIAGVEVETDRGHLVILAPGDGRPALPEFAARAGIRPDMEREFDQVVAIARNESWSGGKYRDALILIAAHADQEGSLLQPRQPLSVDRQVTLAMQLDAVEIVAEGTRRQYIAAGLKNSGREKAIIRASDVHRVGDTMYATWLYLPDVSTAAMRHGCCVPEAAIRFEQPDRGPVQTIETVSFDGGMHSGKTFSLVERTNALIGAPSTGKSLIIDAIRFAFGLQSPIEEVRAISENRLNRRLGVGTTVTVTGTSHGDPFRISRTWGGAQPVNPPFVPIIFGQTELVRRGMEDKPAMALLDVHCEEAPELKTRADEIRADIAAGFAEALALATRAREIGARVNNTEDGLEATRAQLTQLAGSEALARRAAELSRLRSWRERASRSIDEWIESYEADVAPEVPQPPSIDPAVFDATPYVAIQAIRSEQESARTRANEAARGTVARLRQLVMQNEDDLAGLEAQVTRELAAAGFGAGSDLLAELNALRSRLERLEADALELRGTQEAIERSAERLRQLVQQAEHTRDALRDARGTTCTQVNASMRTFYTRLEHDANAEHVDGLLEQAKTGTYQRRTSLGGVRETLDRSRLLEVAIREAEGRSDAGPMVARLEQQDDISRTASGRGQTDTLAAITGSWPEDGLKIFTFADNEPYEDLTEGMRALAIKEISFAASVLPVISDQPEDAVPPQNVFQDLVPTIRKQRVERQFILASHDANIVVAGDVEQVFVLTGQDADISGSLYDPAIRLAAMDILEGGHAAFELRKERYGE